jgi:hypothetical protein
MEGDRRQQHPQRNRSLPAGDARLPAEEQRPDGHVDQDDQLEPGHLVVEQGTPRQRGRKQQRHLGGRESQRAAFAAKRPAPRRDAHQHDRA